MADRPQIRFVFKNRETKKSVDIGAAWLNDEWGSGSCRFEMKDVDGKYPKMSMARALELSAQKKGLILMYGNSDLPFEERKARGISTKIQVVDVGGEEEEELEF